MAEIAPFPNLTTLFPWEPPAAPFQWRTVPKGEVNLEYLFDANGRQLFIGSSAVWRTAETQPKRGGAHG